MVHNWKYGIFFFFPYKGEGNYSTMYLLIEELFLFQTRLIFSFHKISVRVDEFEHRYEMTNDNKSQSFELE